MTTMPISRILIVLGSLLLIAGLLITGWQFRSYDPEPSKPANPVVATVGTRLITLRDIEQVAALSLYQADQHRSHLLHQALQQKIEETLLEAEASRKGVSVSQLLAEASQSETIARLANLPAPVKQLKPGTTQDNPDHGSAQDLQEQDRIRQALLVSLRRKADIRITLQSPIPPILPINVNHGPSIGPVDAPVTIVEFSDFQCPYCQKSVGVLKELRRIYGEKIRMVYRDYPGPNHPFAVQAAEAAHCAGEQGKFWEYHDLLFERQAQGSGWDFAALAIELGLKDKAFATCLTTGRYQQDVLADLQEGMKLGINSTPTFFVNGRPLMGARPAADFVELIDPLLRKSAKGRDEIS